MTDTLLARNWSLVALRGAVALIFGLLTLFNPGLTLRLLVLFFGVYVLVDGLVAAGSALANRRDEQPWGSLLIVAILEIGIGFVTLFWPGVTGMALLYIVAFWAIIMGLGAIFTAIRLRKVVEGEWLLALAGVLSVVFGVVVAFFPGAGALAIAIWIGAYAILLGGLLLALAFRLRGWARDVEAMG